VNTMHSVLLGARMENYFRENQMNFPLKCTAKTKKRSKIVVNMG